MSYTALYRKWRPPVFDDVRGQDPIVSALRNQIINGRMGHAYLFCGTRGTGKTSVAKIFAKAVNCEHPVNGNPCNQCPSCRAVNDGISVNVIEIDAASNNGVDNIREIREEVRYAPTDGRFKVYIIDEVHMLSTGAFNALLKTLEEPPAHVIFILATTDPQKVIPTVLSRCQRYNFAKINTYEIKKRTVEVLDAEGIAYEEKAVEEIARMAEGGMRDALSLLEQCLAYNPKELTLEDVEKIFGLTAVEREVDLYLKVHANQVSEVIRSLRDLYIKGTDCKRLAIDMLDIIKDALIYSDQGRENLLTRITPAEAQDILSNVSVDAMLKDASELEDIISRERQKESFLTYLELCFVKMAGRNAVPETKTVEVRQKEEEPQPEEEIPEPVKEEPVEEENPASYVVEPEKDFLLSILLDANKDLKISDQIIYNKLDLYIYEPEKRKFYQMLIGTELFASNKDAIIICGNRNQADNINTRSNNMELYDFLNSEFGIDKMVYAIDEATRKELISMYKATPVQERNKPVYVEKYQRTNKELSSEEKLVKLFGDDVKVEE